MLCENKLKYCRKASHLRFCTALHCPVEKKIWNVSNILEIWFWVCQYKHLMILLSSPFETLFSSSCLSSLITFPSTLILSFTHLTWFHLITFILHFYLCSPSFFFSFSFPPPFCKWVSARLLSFYPQSLVPSTLPALLALFSGCSEWAGWEAPDWLQAVPLPGLTSRHCFCPLNRINKSMCQVDCSQETMTQFWHHWTAPHPHPSPSPPLLPHCSF